MSKQPHVIITVGTPGAMMKAAAPDNYSVEAIGYDMEDVVRLITAVHDLVRPVEDDDEELPIPFKIPGFTLMSKLSEVNAEAWRTMTGQMSGDDSNAAAHSIADGLDRCDCGTNTPSPGRIAVRLNGVNHRFPTYSHARDFVELYGLNHTAVFIRDASDPSLCCFPYVFQLPTGEHMAFETRGMAEELARVNGIDFDEITYHEDEHRPEHRVDEEQWRARTNRAQDRAAGVPCSDDCACHRLSLTAADGPGMCSDTQCGCHAVAEALRADIAAAEGSFAEVAEQDARRADDRADATLYAYGSVEEIAARSGLSIPAQRIEEGDVAFVTEAPEADGDPSDTTWQVATDNSGEIIGYKIPEQADEDRAVQSKPRLPRRTAQRTGENTEAFLAAPHPNPCLPGCSCGNGPAPLAADNPTDG